MGMPATTNQYWLPADLEQFPEGNGCKYECIDGVLLVTPAPRVVHVAALAELSDQIGRCLAGRGIARRVITSTADLRLEPTAVVEPDLFVLRAPVTAKTRLDDPACAVLVAEEHLTHSGLGAMCAQAIAAATMPVPMEFVGVQNRYGESGTWDEVLTIMGLTAEGVEQAVRRVIARKR